ncbi:MAG: phosphate/phosphite/phosphonate ABC transporter substrate-binding protein [Bdellovibrionales bacterium]|nr:phosphate/phosphite/phosphonate ABC transporter substrate-binding protein [Bdellovibrionales bacterium]
MKSAKTASALIALAALITLTSCTRKKAELGTVDNPIKFFMVPSVDTKLLEDAAQKLKIYLEKNTPYKYKISIPSSYVAVVEAFGTNRADVSAINTFGYLLAHDKYGAQARLNFIRFGSSSYQSQIIARKDSKINKLEDINGKKFAFVDPSSTSGYLMPAKLFLDHHIKPSDTMFAQKHDNVVTMVYQGQVDAGATYHSPMTDGKIEDARRLVKTQFPDIEEKVKIVALTDKIPNDPIIFRKDVSNDIQDTISDALINFQKTETGKDIFYKVYGATGIVKTSDMQYDSVREMLKALNKKATDF